MCYSAATRLVLQRAAAHHEKDLASRVTHREARDQAEAAVKKAGQTWKRREEQLEDLHVSNKSRLANLEMQLREQKAFGGENAAAKQAADAERIKLLEEKLSRLWQDTQKAHSDLAEANERVGQADADLHKALVRLGQKISEQAQTSHKLTAVQQDRDWHDKGRTFMARKVAQQQGQIAGMARDAKTAEQTLAAQIEQAEAHKAEAEVKAQAVCSAGFPYTYQLIWHSYAMISGILSKLSIAAFKRHDSSSNKHRTRSVASGFQACGRPRHSWQSSK